MINPHMIIGIIVFYVVSVGGVAYKSYSMGGDAVRLEWKNANEEMRKEFDKKQKEIDAGTHAVEKEALLVEEKIKIIYKDKIQEVIKYVENNNVSVCFNDDGVQLYNRIGEGRLSDIKTSRKLDDYLSGKPTEGGRGD